MKRRAIHILYIACVLGLACLPMLTGCNAQDARNIAQDTGRIAKDAGAAAGNAQLAARVNTTLAQRKGVHLRVCMSRRTGAL